MKQIILFCLLFLWELSLFAQTGSGSLQGKVLDSLGKASLELANISICGLKDRSIKKKLLTDSNGFFEVKGLPLHDSLELLISYTGYSNYKKHFCLNGKPLLNLGSIIMRAAVKELDTVLVKAQIPPVIIKKDTVEYNASSFKTRPNAVVEDLLKKLPGLEVDVAGNITFNGKRVSKILVDGRDFFAGDPLMATRNLPVNLVSKIQVMDTRTLEQAFSNRLTNGMDKTLNIKLKKVNSFFGNVSAGAGTDDRYDLGGMANLFTGARKISLIGASNNINKIGFSSGSELSIVNPGNGITSSKLGGINYIDEWGKRVKVNGSYFLDNVNTTNESIIARKQIILEDSSFSTNSKSTQQDNNTGHRVQFSIDYVPDSSNSLNISPSFNTRRSQNSSSNNVTTTAQHGEKINESKGDVSSDGSNNNYALQLFWGRRLNKNGRAFTLGFNGSQAHQKTSTLNRSQNIFYRNNIVDSIGSQNQRVLTVGDNSSYNFNFSYYEPLGKWLKLIFNENLSKSYSNTDKNTYNLDTSGRVMELDTAYSGNFSSHITSSTSSLSLEFNMKKWEISTGLSAFYNYLDNYISESKDHLQEKQLNYSPSVNINYHINKEKNIRFNYSASTQQPGLDQLQPVPDNSNPLYIRMGNPDLKPSFSQSYSAGYSMFSTSNNVDVGFQYSPTNNKIINSVFYDNYGRQVSQFVNVNGTFNLGGNLSFGRNWKTGNSNTRISLNTGINYNRDLSLINNIPVISKAASFSSSINAVYNYKDIISAECNYALSYNNMRYNNNNDQGTDYVLHTLYNNISVSLFKSFRLLSNISYSYNNSTPAGFNRSSLLWNLGLGQSFLKSQKLQMKLVVYDVLKQNNNLHRTISGNYIEDAQSAILQRYGMLSLSYNFNALKHTVGKK